MQVIVQEAVAGKYGPQLKLTDGSYLSFSKFYKGDTSFPAGSTLDVDMYISEKGNKYANSIKPLNTASAKAEEKPKKKPKIAEDVHGDVPTVPPNMLPPAVRDFNKEAKGKTRCALLEALFSNPTVDLKNQNELRDMVEWGVSVVFDEVK